MTLNDLVVVEVQSDNACNSDLNEAVNKFASTKTRRHNLRY